MGWRKRIYFDSLNRQLKSKRRGFKMDPYSHGWKLCACETAVVIQFQWKPATILSRKRESWFRYLQSTRICLWPNFVSLSPKLLLLWVCLKREQLPKRKNYNLSFIFTSWGFIWSIQIFWQIFPNAPKIQSYSQLPGFNSGISWLYTCSHANSLFPYKIRIHI